MFLCIWRPVLLGLSLPFLSQAKKSTFSTCGGGCPTSKTQNSKCGSMYTTDSSVTQTMRTQTHWLPLSDLEEGRSLWDITRRSGFYSILPTTKRHLLFGNNINDTVRKSYFRTLSVTTAVRRLKESLWVECFFTLFWRQNYRNTPWNRTVGCLDVHNNFVSVSHNMSVQLSMTIVRGIVRIVPNLY